jgi:hypothetical protein
MAGDTPNSCLGAAPFGTAFSNGFNQQPSQQAHFSGSDDTTQSHISQPLPPFPDLAC